MNIYIGNQSEDYKKRLTDALLNSSMAKKHNFIFSENREHGQFDPKECLQSCEIMVADVSHPTILLGIEMGWADNYDVAIICVCSKGTAISSHLTRMSKDIIIYTDTEDLVEELEWMIETKYKKKSLTSHK